MRFYLEQNEDKKWKRKNEKEKRIERWNKKNRNGWRTNTKVKLNSSIVASMKSFVLYQGVLKSPILHIRIWFWNRREK